MKGAAAVLAVAMSIAGCIVRHVEEPRLTGTCAGACEHYIQCKPGHSPVDRQRCASECPTVFADEDSLMAFESLSCRDVVEYVDGVQSRAVAR